MLRYEARVNVALSEVFVTCKVNQKIDVGFKARNL